MKKLLFVAFFICVSSFAKEPINLTEFGDFIHFVYRNEDTFLKKDAIKKVDFTKFSNNYRVQLLTVLTEDKRARRSESEDLSFFFKEKFEALNFIKEVLRICSEKSLNEVQLDEMFKSEAKKENKPIIDSGSSIIK